MPQDNTMCLNLLTDPRSNTSTESFQENKNTEKKSTKKKNYWKRETEENSTFKV